MAFSLARGNGIGPYHTRTTWIDARELAPLTPTLSSKEGGRVGVSELTLRLAARSAPPGLTFRLRNVEMPTTTQPRDPERKGGAMPTVRLRHVSEYPESAQKLFELSKAWFNHDFPAPPAMSR